MNELVAPTLDARRPVGAPAPRLRVAYLINQYPKVSHSFIRREILALERQGVTVQRIAVRGWDDVAPDPADAVERTRMRYLLQHGLAPLLGAAARLALTRPERFFGAARLAFAMWRRSDRTIFHHLAYLAEACALVGWLAAERIAHLHAHFGTNPAEVAMLARELGAPSHSFTVLGPEEFDKPEALDYAIYLEEVLRLSLQAGDTPRARWARAFFLVVGKLPEAVGVIKSWWQRASGRTASLIEYK